MSATKVTLLFHAVTRDASGGAQRLAGFSESYYSTLAIESAALFANWNNLCIARAGLMPANVTIIGSRYQKVDPTGASRQFDTVYPPTTTVQNDLPGVSLQWTVRGFNTVNQRSLILRGIPDGRVVNGEYSPSLQYNNAINAFFARLKADWQFRAIDRTVLPVKIVSIVGGLMTTAQPHGLAANDVVNIMSTKVGTDRVVTSYQAGVLPAGLTANTANLFLAGRGENVPDSVFGRVRKHDTIYPFFSITDGEQLTPTAIHRKAGAPFKKFRGRRTVRH
jgi:hypothetical protein